jgi:uncharacterized protein (TIGR03437 family)
MIAASVSSDGQTVAITILSDCTFGTPCATSVDRYLTEVRRPGTPMASYPGTGSLSPNGRFLLLGSPVLSPFRPGPLMLIDLTTGETRRVPTWNRPAYRHSITNEGAVVIVDDRPRRLRSWNGEERQVAEAGAINAAGDRIVYVRYLDNTPRIAVFDVGSGASRDLDLLPERAPASYSISDDGDIVAWAAGGQARTVRTSDSARTPVDVGGAPVQEVALSGDGTKLLVITGDASIVRIDLRTMTAEGIVAPTPYLPGTNIDFTSFAFQRVLAAGGLYEFRGAGLAAVVGVRILQRELKLIRSEAGRVVFHVPFDLPQGADHVELTLRDETSSPFQGALVVQPAMATRMYAPQWYRIDRQIAAAHEQFDRLVTPDDPARPGEIVHVYGSGFGPVDPVPPLGEPAASHPLSVLRDPVECRIQNQSAAVLFAGLAPGFIGLFQLDVRIPESLQPVESYLECTVQDAIIAGLLAAAP